MAQFYAIADEKEARAYWEHPLLQSRLIEITEALLSLPSSDPVEVMGSIDALKLRSCMTLFDVVSDHPIFSQVLNRFYQGQKDERTLDILKSMDQSSFFMHK